MKAIAIKPAVIKVKGKPRRPAGALAYFNFSLIAARKFLEKGDKVKVTLRVRGRELAHMSSNKHILDDLAEQLADCSVIEKPAKVALK